MEENKELSAEEKKELSEEEIKVRYITPALEKAGWDRNKWRMEYFFTDGQIVVTGEKYSRKTGKRADYALFAKKNDIIAIVEAKDNNKTIGHGIQQAKEYAEILDVKFAYSSNGDGFVEYDFITGQERNLTLDQFPTLQELEARRKAANPLTEEQQKIVDTPYYYDSSSYEPRYYQRIAINRTVEAIAKGQQRVLLVMATGTGKTYTAFQIIHRLRASGLKKKILYLADRNILIDQTMVQDFKPFREVMTKVQGKTMDSAFEIYMALYQQLVGKEGEEDPFTQVQKDFFDLIIVDECHRGSVREDSEWRKCLEYFSSATQIGMTATPRSENDANNVDYFGKPLYTYSLKQGILDGFLAPYRVTQCNLKLDMDGFTPEPGEVDMLNQVVENKEYLRNDYGRSITFLKRRCVVANRITKMLKQIGRMTKTIVFCTDDDEAEAMRQLLTNLNSDMCKQDSRYVMRITGNDKAGKAQLDNFIDANEPFPTVVTTCELLSTGVDCKTCGLIVIDQEISSMIKFKQIIGRGTRIRLDKGKNHLEILDFRGATIKFKDPEFDGEPEPSGEPGGGGGGKPGTSGEPGHRTKYLINGENLNFDLDSELVLVLDADGKTMRTESLIKYAKSVLCKHFGSLDNFIQKWNAADKKAAINQELVEGESLLIDGLRDKNECLKNADLFDIICHVAFDQPPLTRKERANKVKKRNYFAKYQGTALTVLEALLDKYAEHGILDFEQANVLRYPPFDQIGQPKYIVDQFGGLQQYQQAVRELENEIYKQDNIA